MRPMWEKRHRSFAKINSGKLNSIQQRSTVWTLEPYCVTTETNWIFFTLYNVVQNDSGDHFIQFYCCTQWICRFSAYKTNSIAKSSLWEPLNLLCCDIFFFSYSLICEGDILFFLLISIFSTPQRTSTCEVLYAYTCVHAHLSCGALFYRFDDGNSISLFQGKAIASITGSYLGKTTHLPSAKSKASRHREQTHTHTHYRSWFCNREIAPTLVFGQSSEKNAYCGIKMICSVMTFPSHSCVCVSD